MENSRNSAIMQVMELPPSSGIGGNWLFSF
jgi:hypothetical protein